VGAGGLEKWLEIKNIHRTHRKKIAKLLKLFIKNETSIILI